MTSNCAPASIESVGAVSDAVTTGWRVRKDAGVDGNGGAAAVVVAVKRTSALCGRVVRDGCVFQYYSAVTVEDSAAQPVAAIRVVADPDFGCAFTSEDRAGAPPCP